MTLTLAPVILFVYKRPELTLQTLEALAANLLANESILYVFGDGAKAIVSEEDLKKIMEVEKIVTSRNWCKETKFIKRIKNLGLAENILSGVSEVIETHGKAIILEDDIVSSKYFLKYMNDALNLYANDSKVISIGACNFFAKDKHLPETFFIPIPDCWGWATWNDRWKLFEKDGSLLLRTLHENKLLERFNLYGKYNFEQMLVDQIQGRNNSWAIRWQAQAYIKNMLTLYPKYSVVRNIGFDSDATHGGEKSIYHSIEVTTRPINVQKSQVEESALARRLMLETYDNIRPREKTSFFKALKSKLRF